MDPLALESSLNTRFRQTSPPFLQSTPSTDFDWLFLQQHFGVPTRLLDWSENPFVSLYFALSSSKPGEDAALWILDPILWTQSSLTNPGLTVIPDPSTAAATQFYSGLRDPIMPRRDPIAIHSNHTNNRVVAQRGTFTLFGIGKSPMESLSYAKDCLTLFVIDRDLKTRLYEKILRIGYTHSVIYPDLSGLGSEIKTSFGF